MDTNQIKSFAKAARLSIMQSVANRLTFWSIQPDGNHGNAPEMVTGGYIYNGLPYDDAMVPDKWIRLSQRVTNKQSYNDLEEEAAYTWFNRLMVIKIMEENGYIPPTLSLVEGTSTPHLLQRAKMGQHSLTKPADITKLTDHISNSEDEQALQVLLIHLFNTQPVLQVIFGNVPGYMDLLLPTNLLAADGFLTQLDQNDSITTEMYREVELIGWLYQFYISDKKDEVFKGFKNNKKARAQDIPAATQIFTPKWIVKYMVENTVGKIYLDYEKDSDLKTKMKYLVSPQPDAEGEQISPFGGGAGGGPSTSNEQEPLSPSGGGNGGGMSTSSLETQNSTLKIHNLHDLTLIDPAAGSGHILVVGFELLMDMYREQGYTSKNAVREILTHNLHGLDIDDRAMQLARLAILLKAASYDDGILTGDIPVPRIYAFPEAVEFGREEISRFLETTDDAIITEVVDALQLLAQGKNLGSTIQLALSDHALAILKKQEQQWQEKYKAGSLDAFRGLFWERLSAYLPILEILTQRYAAVVANPPYMGQKNMNADLKTFVNKNYELSKSDLFAVFMEVCMDLTVDNGLMGMINQHSWMFLSSYEKLRTRFMESYWLRDMLHLGPRTFEELSGEVVQSTAFVFQHVEPFTEDGESLGNYHRLVDYKSVSEKEENFFSGTDFYPNIPQTNFSKIPGSPVAYWVSGTFTALFQKERTIGDVCDVKSGLSTGNNERFLRNWYEISQSDFSKKGGNKKWFPYNKGGGTQKWFGNNLIVVNYENNAKEIRENGLGVFRNEKFYFEEGITWAGMSSSYVSFKYSEPGYVFDSNKGPMIFSKSRELNISYLLGFFNNKVTNYILNLLNPSVSTQIGDVAGIPILIQNENDVNQIADFSNECVSISKSYWNGLEISWDFTKSPLLLKFTQSLNQAFEKNANLIKSQLIEIHDIEENLNAKFLKLYELDKIITKDVSYNDITIYSDEINFDCPNKMEIKGSVIMSQFISYSVGLMLGRYRLDKPGLNIAHPDPTAEELAPYDYNGITVEIDDDAIIPLMGAECNFQDDILVRLDNILTAIWGKDTLTENKNFLQECLEMTLHKFVTEKFWPYHYKTMYKKKPIYWLFTSNTNSPQKAAFKVLVYMHRMDRFTLSKIRNQYLHPHQEHLQSQHDALNARAESLAKDEAKRLDLLGKQIIECRDFDDRLKALANQQITFDLDDGVTENYKLFAGVVGELK